VLKTETYNLLNRCWAPLLPRRGHFFRAQSRKKLSTYFIEITSCLHMIYTIARFNILSVESLPSRDSRREPQGRTTGLNDRFE
jgi:hypothetical protein